MVIRSLGTVRDDAVAAHQALPLGPSNTPALSAYPSLFSLKHTHAVLGPD